MIIIYSQLIHQISWILVCMTLHNDESAWKLDNNQNISEYIELCGIKNHLFITISSNQLHVSIQDPTVHLQYYITQLLAKL